MHSGRSVARRDGRRDERAGDRYPLLPVGVSMLVRMAVCQGQLALYVACTRKRWR